MKDFLITALSKSDSELRGFLAKELRKELTEDLVEGEDFKSTPPDKLSMRDGQNHHQAKLTPADVVLIRRRSRDGERAGAIARDFPVSAHAVQKVIDKRTWKHVEDLH